MTLFDKQNRVSEQWSLPLRWSLSYYYLPSASSTIVQRWLCWANKQNRDNRVSEHWLLSQIPSIDSVDKNRDGPDGQTKLRRWAMTTTSDVKLRDLTLIPSSTVTQRWPCWANKPETASSDHYYHWREVLWAVINNTSHWLSRQWHRDDGPVRQTK